MIEKVLNFLDKLGEQSKEEIDHFAEALEFFEERYNFIFGYPTGKALLWINVFLLWSVLLLGITNGI